MFIPNYQIHNILKDFTHQLQNDQRSKDADRRLETVVNKVSVTIMDRVTRLSEEESRNRTGITSGRDQRAQEPTQPKSSGTFHYHTMGKDRQKHRQHLAVENPEELIGRFQSLIDENK